MNKIKLLKELLRVNLYMLNRKCLGVTFYFIDDKIYVRDAKTKKLICEEKLSNIGLDYESQKNFLVNIIKHYATYLEFYDEIDWSKREAPITIDNYYYFDVVKDDFYGDAYAYEKYFVELPYNHYDDREIKRMFGIIEENLEDSGVRVVYYHDGVCKEGFYISDCKDVVELDVYYIDNLEKLEDPEYVKSLINKLRKVKDLPDLRDFKFNNKELKLYIDFAPKEDLEEAYVIVKEIVDYYQV